MYTPEGLERGIVGEEKGRDTVERKVLGSNNRRGIDGQFSGRGELQEIHVEVKRGLRDKREWTNWERNYVGKKCIAMASRTLNLMYVRLSAA